jgi:hypothetical protein
MQTSRTGHHTGETAPPRGRLLSTRTFVLAFAAIEAALIGWALLSGRIH